MKQLRARIELARTEWRTVLRGASIRDRLVIASMLAHAHMRLGRARRLVRWVPSLPDPVRRVSLRPAGSVLARRADAIPFHEHFGLDVYGISLPDGPVSTIVDLGANVGFASVALAWRHPEARLVCVEPVEASRALLVENLRRNGIDATVLAVAAVGTAGRFELRPGDHPAGNRVAAAAGGTISGVTLEAILDRASVDIADIVKMDIEGAERGVLEAAHGWASRVRVLIVELHGGLGAAEAQRLLGPYGFVPRPLRDDAGLRDLACFVRDAASDGRPPTQGAGT